MIEILKKSLKFNKFSQADLINIFSHTSSGNFKFFGEKLEINSLMELERRGNLFLLIAEKILQKCQELQLKNQDENLLNFWNIWLPLALQIATKQDSLGHTFIQGFLGGQGTGKTTLTSILKLILQYLDKKTIFF